MGSPVQLVVSYLMPAILGLEFLQQHGLALDFSTEQKHMDVGHSQLKRTTEEVRKNFPYILG